MIAFGRLVLGGSLAVVATGCGTFVTATPLNPSPRALFRHGADSVEVFSSSPPTRPHVDVALLEVEQNDGAGNPVMIEALRERAGAMGCDALFVNGIRGRVVTSATCVVYTDLVVMQPEVTAAPPPPATPPGGRRLCRDRQDFEASRDCVLPRGG